MAIKLEFYIGCSHLAWGMSLDGIFLTKRGKTEGLAANFFVEVFKVFKTVLNTLSVLFSCISCLYVFFRYFFSLKKVLQKIGAKIIFKRASNDVFYSDLCMNRRCL